ncbi:MAG: ribonuclease HII [Phototrophicales bacterium]
MQKKKKKPKTASLVYEKKHLELGHTRIIGLDEAGRGAWAGPVFAGAVALPHDSGDLIDRLAGVRDSKEMTPRQREILSETIQQVAVVWGVGSASSQEIDTLGIVSATKLAMHRALLQAIGTHFKPDVLLLDAMTWDSAPVDAIQQHIIRGDKQSLTIAAASVLAKVSRDRYMRNLDQLYPAYAFGRHKGYGTKAHRAAIERHGITPEHRRCFRPIQEMSR